MAASGFLLTSFLPARWGLVRVSQTRDSCSSAPEPAAMLCQNGGLQAGKRGDGESSAPLLDEGTGARKGRREVILQSSGGAMLAAIFNFSGQRPNYLGVQKNPPSLALCPPTPTCISTSEEFNDPSHYVPPWTYNPEDGRGRTKPVSKEQAMAELVEVIESTKPDNFTPRIVKKTDDYIYVEYESAILGLVHDVEFWFPPGARPICEYRSASRIGPIDLDANRKRIKALRQALEKKGWESVGF